MLGPLGAGTLVVFDRGVPVHPASVAQVAAVASKDRPLCFVPEIPVASQLGLPRYEPILAWFPGVSDRSLERCQRVALTSQAEQIHYFVDHYAAICPNPIQVSVIVGNTCNLHCVMCPYHSRQIKPTHRTDFFHQRRVMSWQLMERIAAECGSMLLPVKIGNVEEPLMHPRIVDFVRQCRRSGVPAVHITTNGTLLTESVGRSLLEAGLTSVYVSLDAARPETYRRIRQGDLDRVERNVRSFLAARHAGRFACRVMLSMVRNEGLSQEEEDEFLARWLPPRGCPETGTGTQHAAEERHALHNVREPVPVSGQPPSDGVIFYHLARYEDGSSRFAAVHEVARSKVRQAGRRWPCLNPWQEVYLLPDGRVYYCCETVSKLAFEHLQSMGRYPEQSLKEVWHGEAFQLLRRDLITRANRARHVENVPHDRWPACQRCGIWMAHVAETVQQGGTRITRNMITEIHEHVS